MADAQPLEGALAQLARVSETLRQSSAAAPMRATEPSPQADEPMADTARPRTPTTSHNIGVNGRGRPVAGASTAPVDINVRRDDTHERYTTLESEDENDIWEGSDEEYPYDPLDCYDDDPDDGSDVDVNADDALWEALPNKEELESWRTGGWDPAPIRNAREDEYPRLIDDYWGPAPEVAHVADHPLWLFFRFFPKKLFHIMAEESTRYAMANLSARAAEIHQWQKKNAARDNVPSEFVETPQQIQRRLALNFPKFTADEYAKLFGLFIARTLCPRMDGLEKHWDPTECGAIAPGTFQNFMSKRRFDDLVKNWHFTDNTDPRAKTDREWKVRPLIDALQEAFKQGYRPGPFLSFGEGALPPPPSEWIQSRRNYKPHKSDTKLFLTCCSVSGYCLRFEVYCGKEAVKGKRLVDKVAGPIAVVRNIDEVLPPHRKRHHLVTMSKNFTSVPLLRELLARKVYAIGLVHEGRVGLPVQLQDEETTQLERVPRGACAAARARDEPKLVACRWWDSRPLFLLGTGASLEAKSIERHSAIYNEVRQVPCPKIVLDYEKHTRGVRLFNHVRHSKLSVQRTLRFKKFYKSVALALLDCALTNAYIAHKHTLTGMAKTPMSHGDFLEMLQAQLVQVKSDDLALSPEERATLVNVQERVVPVVRANVVRTQPRQERPRREAPTAPSATLPIPVEVVPQETVAQLDAVPATIAAPAVPDVNEHYPCETQDFLPPTNEQGRKRMARACKVCSYLAPKGSRGLNTKFFCPGCSAVHSVDVYLCIMARHTSGGLRKTCFQIWHDDWQCGRQLPQGEKRLHFRPPTGKKRPRRADGDQGDDQ